MTRKRPYRGRKKGKKAPRVKGSLSDGRKISFRERECFSLLAVRKKT